MADAFPFRAPRTDGGESATTALGHTWDAWVEHQALPEGVDPAVLTTLDRLHTLGVSPEPAPDFVARLRRELLTPAVGPPVAAFPQPVSANGHAGDVCVALLPIVVPVQRSRRWPGLLATAALLVLTLLGSLLANGGLRSAMLHRPPAMVPAPDSERPLLPPGVTSDSPLMRALIEQFPADPPVWIDLSRITLAPGASEQTGSARDSGVGPQLFRIEAGQVTVVANGPVQITRYRTDAEMDSATSIVSPQTASVLDVGDQVFAPSGVTLQRRNDGAAPATLLTFEITADGEGLSQPGVTSAFGMPYGRMSAVPLPAEASVRRITIAPGDGLPVAALPGLRLVYVETGALELRYRGENTLTAGETPFAATTLRAGNGTGDFGPTPEQAMLTNDGDVPATIIAATVAMADPAETRGEKTVRDGLTQAPEDPLTAGIATKPILD
ncbi:MAG: hypothetical protein U0031_03365 [Thermomicrobiales bacterium]